MVRAKGKHILSPSEISALQSDKQEIDAQIKSVEGREYGSGNMGANVDVGRLKEQSKHLGDRIREGSPGHISGAAKDQLARRASELESQIKQGMPTREEMLRPMRHPGSIRKNQMWEKRNRGAINEYKQVQRQLNPGDPTCSNIERLRS